MYLLIVVYELGGDMHSRGKLHFRGTASTFIVYILNTSILSFKNKTNDQTITPFLNYLALELPVNLQ
jgi:hypothetical protein